MSYDTDKNAEYLAAYEEAFARLPVPPRAVLELGVLHGGSLLMWRDRFPGAVIAGVDVAPVEVDDPSGRVRVYEGEQQDIALLDRVAAECAPDGFDVIVDDASHIGRLTAVSFWHLFTHHLRPGGVYVIEDWGTGYMAGFPDGRKFRGRLDRPSRRRAHQAGMVGVVKQLVDLAGLSRWTEGAPQVEVVWLRMGQAFVFKTL